MQIGCGRSELVLEPEGEGSSEEGLTPRPSRIVFPALRGLSGQGQSMPAVN
ncbi:hypothetical protein ACVLD2_002910 [Paenibacillus sp. PvR052]